MRHRTKMTMVVLCFFVIALGYFEPFYPDNRGVPPNVHVSGEADRNDNTNDFCLAGCPLGASPQDQIVVHRIFELDNNPKTKFADWVAYKITSATLGVGCKRIWKTDSDLEPNSTLSPEDYRGVHKALSSDRGHQAPLASLCGSPYWEEANYLSNITPQKSALNEGQWEQLENAERGLIKRGITDAVYSITGPFYEREMPKMPNVRKDEITPSGYWKILSFRRRETIEVIGFAFDQNASFDGDFCSGRIPVQALEVRTHLHFFPWLGAERNQLQTKEIIKDLGC